MTTSNGERSPSSYQPNAPDVVGDHPPATEQFGPVTADAIRNTPLSEVVGDGREIPLRAEDDRFPTHIPPEVASSPNHAAFREQALPGSDTETRPFYKKTWVRVTAGIAAPALAAGGIFLAPKILGATPEDRPVATSVELKDQRVFPDSVVLSQKFDTLPIDQQARIRTIYDQVKAAYSAGGDSEAWSQIGSRDLLVFKDWIVANNTDQTMARATRQSEWTKTPNLNPTVEVSPFNTPQQLVDRVALEWAVGSSLRDFDGENGTLTEHPEIAAAMASVMFGHDSSAYTKWMASLTDGDKEFGIAPMTVTSYSQLQTGEAPMYKVATRNNFEDVEGADYGWMTLQVVPYTGLDGKMAYSVMALDATKSYTPISFTDK